MRHRNVDYQKVQPYRVGIKHDYFVNKFVKSKLNKRLKINKEELIRECNRSRYNPRDTSGYTNNDIMKPLVEFMKINKNKTRRKVRKGKKTRKKLGGDPTHFRPIFQRSPRRIALQVFINSRDWRSFIATLSRRSRNDVARVINNFIQQGKRDDWIIAFLTTFKERVEQFRIERERRTTEQEEQEILSSSDDEDDGDNNVGTQTVE